MRSVKYISLVICLMLSVKGVAQNLDARPNPVGTQETSTSTNTSGNTNVTVSTGVSVYEFNEVKSALNSANARLRETEEKLAATESNLREAEGEVSVLNSNLENKMDEMLSMTSSFPLVITDIKVGSYRNGTQNVEYGYSLNASSVWDLAPMIVYNGYVNRAITLQVKLYCPNGTEWKHPSFPEESSFFDMPITCKRSENQRAGFRRGATEKQLFTQRGRWRIEFWYVNGDIGRCLGSREFTIN